MRLQRDNVHVFCTLVAHDKGVLYKTVTNFKAPVVWLAPMSGSTDAPMRRQAVRYGAPAVVSEMVAGEALLAATPDGLRRICRHEGNAQWIVQIAGRRPEDMSGGAQLLAEAGVDVIDINMGCPSKQVTGGLSGSALMQDLDLAARLIAATIEGANGLPVTLKMRLGWDHDSLNAPELAKIAEGLGVRLITVHGRTRCMFYKGKADWRRVAETVGAVALPVIVNGDIDTPDEADEALRQSGAYGVMLGRSVLGRPWRVAEVAAHLEGRPWEKPSLPLQLESLSEQIKDSVDLYGSHFGVRTVRKHVSAAIEHLEIAMPDDVRRHLRAKLCRIEGAAELIDALSDVYAGRIIAEAT